MRVPTVTFEQIARPLLAIIFLLAFGGALGVNAAAAVPTEVRHYQLPGDVTAARQACYEQAAQRHGVPSGDAYRAWWNVNEGTAAERAWTADFEACKTAHPMPGGKWNFAGMTLVYTEVIP